MGSGEAVRYGVVGTGMMGCEHLRNLLALDGAEVTAVADPTPSSLELARLTLGDAAEGVVFHSDHRALLAAGDCDVVVVASPNHTHAGVLLDVLDAGVHVLAEKPLCTTVDDCLAVLAAARRGPAGRVVWMGLEYRYLPPVRALLQEVRAGTVGRVRMVAVREHRFPFLAKVGDWNRFTRNTGGTLVEKCCHFFDLMDQVVGERPVRVLASGAQDVNHLDECYDGEVPDVLDNAYVIVEYPGGARALLDLCMFAEATKNEQELCVVGDAGKVEAALPEHVLRVGRRSDGWGTYTERPVADDDIKHTGLHHGASYLEHVDLLRAVRAGSPPLVTLEDGLWSVAVGVAAHRSIDERRPVELAEVLPAPLVDQPPNASANTSRSSSEATAL